MDRKYCIHITEGGKALHQYDDYKKVEIIDGRIPYYQ